MNRQLNLILGILILLFFLSAHFLIGMYFNTVYRPIYFWFWADVFLYIGIILQIYLVVKITFEK